MLVRAARTFVTWETWLLWTSSEGFDNRLASWEGRALDAVVSRD
jgi:hypothetical protein